jgi:hypothetical protein
VRKLVGYPGILISWNFVEQRLVNWRKSVASKPFNLKGRLWRRVHDRAAEHKNYSIVFNIESWAQDNKRSLAMIGALSWVGLRLNKCSHRIETQRENGMFHTRRWEGHWPIHNPLVSVEHRAYSLIYSYFPLSLMSVGLDLWISQEYQMVLLKLMKRRFRAQSTIIVSYLPHHCWTF